MYVETLKKLTDIHHSLVNCQRRIGKLRSLQTVEFTHPFYVARQTGADRASFLLELTPQQYDSILEMLLRDALSEESKLIDQIGNIPYVSGV